ncbi:MAG: hypothetical protein K9L24_04650 [Spirochaetia bacterium]|nr:hypothetical protein [Spirochaetia bacterium]
MDQKTKDQKTEIKKVTTLLNVLSGTQAKQILSFLAKQNPDIQSSIIKEAEKILKTVNPLEVANAVFHKLNSISQDDFFAEYSARNQLYYQHEVEVAYDMFCSAFAPHNQKIDDFHHLGFHEEEFTYLKGTIWGLYIFQNRATTDFYNYVQDQPFNFTDDLITDWKNRHPDNSDGQDTLKKTNKYKYDKDLTDFIANYCPNWDFS